MRPRSPAPRYGRSLGLRPRASDSCSPVLLAQALDYPWATLIPAATRLSRKRRVEGRPLYDSIELLDFNHHEARRALDYLLKVLPVLGFRYGAVYAEVMVGPEGPRLIEVAARLSGARLPEIFSQALSNPAITAYADLLLSPETFAERPSRLLSPSAVAFLRSSGGRLGRTPSLNDIELKSEYCELIWSVPVGEVLPSTVDLFTSPGMVVLRDQDRSTIFSDLFLLREEASAFFQ